MSNPSQAKMWADIIIFFIALIPLVLSTICFGVAGLLFIIHDITPVIERLLVMGAGLIGIAFLFGFAGLVHKPDTPVEEDDKDVVDN